MTNHNKKSLILKLRPGAHDVRWVSGGDVNDVIVADNTETFRFPRNDEGRQQLVYEFEVLKLLQNNLTLSVPRPLELAPDKTFSIVSFVPGHSLKETEIYNLPTESQIMIGKAVAQFIIELNNAVEPVDLVKLQPLRPEMENWDDWYDSMAKLSKVNNSRYQEIFAAYLAKFKQQYPDGLSNGKTIIHDDLHAGNLIFDDDQRVVGVIDFGDVTLGDIHRELRPVYRMGKHVFDTVVQELSPRFGDIRIDAVRVCAVVHELAVMIEHEDADTLDSRRAEFAKTLLNLWLGQDWENR